MTKEEREEAIDIFEHNWTRLVNGDYTEEELNMAISKALEALKAEPCGDCVSREAVADMAGLSDWFESSDDYNDFLNELEKLPSVTPEHKKGEWIEFDHGMGCRYLQCPYCGEFMSKSNNHSFCPNCGADMRG